MVNASIYQTNEQLKTSIVYKNVLPKILPILIGGSYVRLRTQLSLIQTCLNDQKEHMA